MPEHLTSTVSNLPCGHTDWLLLPQMFNEAERRWAETIERIARQQHSADLLAMAAEALMIPEAWNLKQVQTSYSLQHLPVSRGMKITSSCQSALCYKARVCCQCHCLVQLRLLGVHPLLAYSYQTPYDQFSHANAHATKNG